MFVHRSIWSSTRHLPVREPIKLWVILFLREKHSPPGPSLTLWGSCLAYPSTDARSKFNKDPLLSLGLVLPNIFILILRKRGKRDMANFTSMYAAALVTKKSYQRDYQSVQ